MATMERSIAKATFAKLLNKSDVQAVGDDYQPQGQAIVAFASTDPELVLSGPAGTGKTRVNLQKIHRELLRYPGARALILRKTRASLAQSVLVTYERDVLGVDHPICSGVQREYRKSYRYPNGSEIVVGGMDKPEKVLSTEYDLIYVAEAIELTLTDWETLNSRMRNLSKHNVMPYQQILADTNPDSDQHWLLKRSEAGVTRMINCTHEDNPMLFNAATGEWTEAGKRYVFGTLERLTGVRYLRLRWGKWVQAEGAVYEEYSSPIHLIDKFEIPKNWRRFRVIDFGYRNPFVCQWWAISPDNVAYRYREIYMTERLVEDHARQINKLSQGENIEATIADHDAEDRATLERYGIKTIPAKKEITVGIEAVQARLRVHQIEGKQVANMYLLRDSLVEQDDELVKQALPTCTEEEFPSYTYPKGVDGKPKKEVPVDLNNHGMDATRYFVMHVDQPRKVSLARAAAKGLYD